MEGSRGRESRWDRMMEANLVPDGAQMWKPEQRGARGHQRTGATKAPYRTSVPEGRRPRGMKEEEEFPAGIPSETAWPQAGKAQLGAAALGRG